MITIYHNPRCKKSREGLNYLKNAGIEYEIIDYINHPLTVDELKKILIKLNKRPYEIVRIQEDYYKRELKGKNFTDDEWLDILLENPKLIQRPIVSGKYKAVIAQPPELMNDVIK